MVGIAGDGAPLSVGEIRGVGTHSGTATTDITRGGGDMVSMIPGYGVLIGTIITDTIHTGDTVPDMDITVLIGVIIARTGEEQANRP